MGRIDEHLQRAAEHIAFETALIADPEADISDLPQRLITAMQAAIDGVLTTIDTDAPSDRSKAFLRLYPELQPALNELSSQVARCFSPEITYRLEVPDTLDDALALDVVIQLNENYSSDDAHESYSQLMDEWWFEQPYSWQQRLIFGVEWVEETDRLASITELPLLDLD
jgi:hypothetical protein